MNISFFAEGSLWKLYLRSDSFLFPAVQETTVVLNVLKKKNGQQMFSNDVFFFKELPKISMSQKGFSLVFLLYEKIIKIRIHLQP